MRIAILLLLALLCPASAQAELVPESERIPVDLRRTTLVVRDIDASLPLYRDGLGLKVIYDQQIGGGKHADGSEKKPTIRLVLLRANDTFIGALGLMQRLDIGEMAAPVFERAMPGDSILVFNARDLDTRWPRIKALPGVRVHTEPTRMEYPGPNGTIIPVMFTAVFDPDGNFIEVNQLLGEAAGTTAPAADTAPRKSD